MDGKPERIIVADGGMIAIRIPKGAEELQLIYHEPGFTAGRMCSVIGISLFAVWIFVHKRGMIKL